VTSIKNIIYHSPTDAQQRSYICNVATMIL